VVKHVSHMMESMEFHIKLATFLAELLDNKFKVMGFRFGLDPILGFIPGVGDLVTIGLSFYLMWIGNRINLPADKMRLMMMNMVTDFVLGLIPFFGDISDFVYKANAKNLAILLKHMETKSSIIQGEILR
jgi:hypothetical protein